jgi:hypothetical protein
MAVSQSLSNSCVYSDHCNVAYICNCWSDFNCVVCCNLLHTCSIQFDTFILTCMQMQHIMDGTFVDMKQIVFRISVICSCGCDFVLIGWFVISSWLQVRSYVGLRNSLTVLHR